MDERHEETIKVSEPVQARLSVSRAREAAIRQIARLCHEIHAERVFRAQQAASLVGKFEPAETPDFHARAEALLEDAIVGIAEKRLIALLRKQLEEFR